MVTKCENCGADMIPGLMSEGWCAAECDLREEPTDPGGGTATGGEWWWPSSVYGTVCSHPEWYFASDAIFFVNSADEIYAKPTLRVYIKGSSLDQSDKSLTGLCRAVDKVIEEKRWLYRK